MREIESSKLVLLTMSWWSYYHYNVQQQLLALLLLLHLVVERDRVKQAECGCCWQCLGGLTGINR